MKAFYSGDEGLGLNENSRLDLAGIYSIADDGSLEYAGDGKYASDRISFYTGQIAVDGRPSDFVDSGTISGWAADSVAAAQGFV